MTTKSLVRKKLPWGRGDASPVLTVATPTRRRRAPGTTPSWLAQALSRVPRVMVKPRAAVLAVLG